MADHFYSMAVGQIGSRDPSIVKIGTSTAAGSDIEIRITDGTIRRDQAYKFLEYIADLIASNSIVLPTGGFTG